MTAGIAFIVLAVGCAVAGYLLRRKLYPGWEQERIGALDTLFSLSGLFASLLYLLFHILWFGATATALILGLSWLSR